MPKSPFEGPKRPGSSESKEGPPQLPERLQGIWNSYMIMGQLESVLIEEQQALEKGIMYESHQRAKEAFKAFLKEHGARLPEAIPLVRGGYSEIHDGLRVGGGIAQNRPDVYLLPRTYEIYSVRHAGRGWDGEMDEATPAHFFPSDPSFLGWEKIRSEKETDEENKMGRINFDPVTDDDFADEDSLFRVQEIEKIVQYLEAHATDPVIKEKLTEYKELLTTENARIEEAKSELYNDQIRRMKVRVQNLIRVLEEDTGRKLPKRILLDTYAERKEDTVFYPQQMRIELLPRQRKGFFTKAVESPEAVRVDPPEAWTSFSVSVYPLLDSVLSEQDSLRITRHQNSVSKYKRQRDEK